MERTMSTNPPTETGHWGHEVSERLTTLETEMKHYATKAWVMGGMLIAGGISGGIVSIVVTFLA